MGLKTFYHVDRRYFHYFGKFEWLIHYLLLLMNDFVFLNPLKCQFRTNSTFFVILTQKTRTKKVGNGLKYILSVKFEWLIQYLLLVINEFLFLNLLKCQVCTNCDIFSDCNIKNNTEKSWKWD